MTNGSWLDEWNKIADFVEEVIGVNCLENEHITVQTYGNPKTRFNAFQDPPTISIVYLSVRDKKQRNERFELPPELLCDLTQATVVLIIKELLAKARYDGE